MKKIENDCVDCGLPCLGSTCPFRNNPHYYCDQCENEEPLYLFNGQELCVNCILDKLDKVEESWK